MLVTWKNREEKVGERTAEEPDTPYGPSCFAFYPKRLAKSFVLVCFIKQSTVSQNDHGTRRTKSITFI